MARDLPAELWSEVISHLPREYVRKLLGVNRYLTEMALDEIYHSFTLNNGYPRTVSDIQRITEPKYASRVKRLDIHSYFLDRLTEPDYVLIMHDLSMVPYPPPPPNPAKKSPLHALGKRLRSLKLSSRILSRSNLLSGLVHKPLPVQPKVLTALDAALSRWRQLEEINLFLHDYVFMPSFSDFLADLWSQKGKSIRILNIDASPGGLVNFLQISSRRLAPFPNLAHLSMRLASSEPYAAQGNPGGMGHQLATFIRSHEHSLHTLIISEPIYARWIDILSLIQDLGCLPKLKKIELPVLMTSGSDARLILESLEKLLRLNAHTLKCLVLVYRQAFPLSLPHDTYFGLLDRVLPKLRFPILFEFNMKVYDDSILPRVKPFHLPPLQHLAPNLKKLKLKGSDGHLSDYEFTGLLKNLSTGAIRLRSFDFQFRVLRPENFDQLALNIPTLEYLSITYTAVSVNMDEPFHPQATAFWEGFRREYVDWPLRYLRLARKSACKGGHPNSRLSARVGKYIPRLEINDVSRSCNCVLVEEVVFA